MILILIIPVRFTQFIFSYQNYKNVPLNMSWIYHSRWHVVHAMFFCQIMWKGPGSASQKTLRVPVNREFFIFKFNSNWSNKKISTDMMALVSLLKWILIMVMCTQIWLLIMALLSSLAEVILWKLKSLIQQQEIGK